MKIIDIDLRKIDNKVLDEVAKYFLQGKVVVFPTDTIYGIGCLATNARAIKKIFKIKRRSQNKALLILVKSISQLKRFTTISPNQEKYLKKNWPGPVSFILKKKEILPSEIAPGKNTVACRLPKNDFLIRILKRVGLPIVASSLNISGKKHLADVNNLDKYLNVGDIDVVVNIGPKFNGKPSRLLDITDMSDIKVLRK